MNYRQMCVFAASLILGWLLSACVGLSSADINTTMTASSAMMGTESAGINSAIFAQRTAVRATMTSKETELAQALHINQQIGATLAASSSPTPGLTVGRASESDIAMADADIDIMNDERRLNNPAEINMAVPTGALNTNQFLVTGVASSVDANSDCPLDVGVTFPSTVTKLYATLNVFDLPAGAPLRAEWYFNGEVQAADDWLTPRNFDDACLWFVLESSRVTFSPGEWRVSLFAYGLAIGDSLVFTITSN